jgi:hypothetical protein
MPQLPQIVSSNLNISTNSDRFYFDVWQHTFLPNFRGAFQEGYWIHVVPQVCHDQPFVLDMLIALSALTVAKGTPDALIARRHAAFAIERYQRALLALRKSLAATPNVRTGRAHLFSFEEFGTGSEKILVLAVLTP